MSFYLSKIFWILINPFNILMFLSILTIFFLFIKKFFFSYLTAFFFIFFFIVFCIIPTGSYLIYVLEKKFHTPFIAPNKVDGILILGGATNANLSSDFNQVTLNNSAERLVESIKIIKKYENAIVVYSGGSGGLIQPKIKHTDVAKRFFIESGLGHRNILFESESRNTYENILFSKKLINPNINQKWVVVTSAHHMNRAILVAEKINWDLIPYPVDFRKPKEFVFSINPKLFSNLTAMNQGMYEWVGLIYYYFLNRTDRII